MNLKDINPEKLFSFLQDAGNYEQRKVGRNDINGVTVSTCYTTDMGYETAILDENGSHPVERYSSKEDALNGHIKWCIEAKTIKTIIELGWIEELGIEQNLITIKRKV